MLDATRLRVLVAVARHGSVTAAAQALNYAQPSVSHHMARLEAETGAKLIERAGRGIRLTEAGRLLAERAEEILGRLDAAEAELAAYIGLRHDRVRLAAFGSALGTLAAAATVSLRAEHPDTDIHLTQAEPADALRMLRAGEVDVALIFRYPAEQAAADSQTGRAGPDARTAQAEPGDPRGEDDLRFQVVLDEPVYLITPARQARQEARSSQAGPSLASDLTRIAGYAGQHWIAGCERCKEFMTFLCHSAGFAPDIAVSTDDYVAVQALVATGLGVALLPGLALRAVRHPGIEAVELSGVRRHVLAVTYGAPPDPLASSRLIAALTRAAAGLTSDSRSTVGPVGIP
jgi:DNA-binding transcriptional LysR family regulator